MSDSGGLITTAELPATAVLDSAGVNAPLADRAGNQLVNIPAWQTLTLYPSGYVIQNGGVAYAATATFTSGASFAADGANWAALSSSELAYAAITSAFTTTSTTLVDVPGLSISVVSSGRPFMIRLVMKRLINSLGGGAAQPLVLRTTDSVFVAGDFQGIGSATEGYGVILEGRQALAAGTYTYKVQILSSNAGNTVTIDASAAIPSFLQAVQV